MMRCSAAAAMRAIAQPLRSSGVSASGADKRSAGLGGSGADASSSGSSLKSASDSDITIGAGLLARKRANVSLAESRPPGQCPGASLPPIPIGVWRPRESGGLGSAARVVTLIAELGADAARGARAPRA